MVDLEFLKVYWKQYVLLEKRMLDLSDYVAIHRNRQPHPNVDSALKKR